MADKYTFDPNAYKRRLEREKARPDLKERFKMYEKVVNSQPTFDNEAEALGFALKKVKAGESWTVWVAPKELGGKWKAISWSAEGGRGPDAADQLGWSIIYDNDMLNAIAHKDIDNIKEV